MAQKILALDAAGNIVEFELITVSSGAGDAGKAVGLGLDGKWDLSTMPSGIGPQVKPIEASEALTAPCMVNIWNDSGTAKVRYADASTAAAGKVAHGFILASVASGAVATVYFEGEVSGLSGLTPGSRYNLSATTPGAVVTTVATTAGHIHQYVGVATSDTSLDFEPARPIIRA